jgi:hypothetical protein
MFKGLKGLGNAFNAATSGAVTSAMPVGIPASNTKRKNAIASPEVLSIKPAALKQVDSATQTARLEKVFLAASVEEKRESMVSSKFGLNLIYSCPYRYPVGCSNALERLSS